MFRAVFADYGRYGSDPIKWTNARLVVFLHNEIGYRNDWPFWWVFWDCELFAMYCECFNRSVVDVAMSVVLLLATYRSQISNQ